MKAWIASLVLLVGLSAHAKDVVLVSGFDPFGGNRVNNSWVAAQRLAENFKNHPSIEVVTCLLPTTFAGGYPKLEECYNRLPMAPKFVLALGEGPCTLNLETQVYNLDHNPRGFLSGSDPDNAGVHRRRSAIIAGAPFNVGLRVDVGAFYCALNERERGQVEISATPGNFVCNNAAYQFTSAHPEAPFTFAHVLGQKCQKPLATLNENIAMLGKVILAQVALANAPAQSTPHISNSLRLPVFKAEVTPLIEASQGCLQEFYKKLQADQIK